MGKNNSDLGLCVVVVGDPRQESVPTVVQWAREREFDVRVCENVYTAVVALAQAAGRRLLVVGKMHTLAGENVSFLRIAAAHGVRCCCWLDAGSSRRGAGRGEILELLAAARAGATVVADVQEVRSVLREGLAAATSRETRAAPRESACLLRHGYAAEEVDDDLRATEAELTALLR